MASKGLYFKDVQPLIKQGELMAIGNTDSLQVVKPCEVLSQRPVLRKKAKQQELVDVEEKIKIDKGILLAPYWRKANLAEQIKLESLPKTELQPWWVRKENGGFRIRVLSHIKDIHAAIRQSLRHIPRNFLGQEIRLKGKTLSLPGRLQALAALGEEFLNLKAGIIELANAPPSAVEEVIESLTQFNENISAAIKELESLQRQASPISKQIPAASARLLIDLRIMEKYLRRAEQLIAFDKTLKEKIGWGYEKLMEIIDKAQGGKVAGKDIARAQGIYNFLTEHIHVNPYYAERIASPEFQRLDQIKKRTPRAALNAIKSAAFKLEAVALPVVQTQISQRRAYYQQAIKEFSQGLSAIADLAALLKDVVERVKQVLKSDCIAIFLNDPKSLSYMIREKLNLEDRFVLEAKFKTSSGLIRLLKQESKIWSLQEMIAVQKALERHELKQLRACKAEWLAPMIVKDELTGFLTLAGESSGKEYDQDGLGFLLNLCSQAALAIEGLQLRRQHSARQQELEAAREIQKNLLPRVIPAIKGCRIAALCESCLEVGGDYYELLKFSDHKVGMMIADVVGKGAPAALLMSSLQATVKVLATEGTPPDVLVQKVNNLIADSITPNRYITFFYGVVDTREKVLTYTNAGHNPPLLFRADGSHVCLDKGGTVVGLFPNGRYEQEQIKLESGDLLVLYTDGVTEVTNAADEEFGETRLRERIVAWRRKPVDELLQRVHQAIRAFAQGAMQDDLTLVIASIL